MKKISILVSSTENNQKLAESVEQRASLKNLKANIVNLVSYNLPLYTTSEQNKGIPDSVAKLLEDISDAESFLVLAPEYNGSMPPVLNNAIAWLSVSTGEWRDAFNGKSVALGTFSGGAGQNVITAMRLQFAYIGANVIGRCLTANGQKPASDESIDAVLEQLAK